MLVMLQNTQNITVTRNGEIDKSFERAQARTEQINAIKDNTSKFAAFVAIHTMDLLYKAYDDLNDTNQRPEWRAMVGLPALMSREVELEQGRNLRGQFV